MIPFLKHYEVRFDQVKCILCPTWGNCSDKCSDFQRILYRLLWRGLISFWQHSAVTAPHWPNYIISCYYLFSSLQIFLSRYIYMCVSEWGHSKEKEKKERGGEEGKRKRLAWNRRMMDRDKKKRKALSMLRFGANWQWSTHSFIHSQLAQSCICCMHKAHWTSFYIV